MGSCVKSEYIADFCKKASKIKVLWNTVKWSVSGEQMSTVRLFMQSFFTADCTALSLCHQFISKFFSKCAVSCSVLYFRGLHLQLWEGSFFPAQSNFCITMWFCLVYEVEGWGSCHWWTVFQGDTKVKQDWALNVVWSCVLGWLWLNCRTWNWFFP